MKKQIFVLSIFVILPKLVFAQMKASESDWKPLVDEPSRSQLLESQTADQDELSFDSLPSSFTFPKDAPTNGYVFGVDLSHYTASGFPYTKLTQQNIYFAYAKATQGSGFKDPKFGEHWKALGTLSGAQKVYRGAYHFLSSSSTDSPVTQAERFVAYVNLQGGFRADDLPPVVDLEWDKTSTQSSDSWAKRSPQQIEAAVLAFLNRVEQLTGKIPMIYTCRSWWLERRIPEADFRKFSRYPIWIADYSKRALASEQPSVPDNTLPTLWQFSESAKMSSGYRSSFDANVYHGSLLDFTKALLNPAP